MEEAAIIEKVRKLLALAKNNPNENEAALAAGKAMELLAAYNLDMATVDSINVSHKKREDKKSGGGLYQWQRQLWAAACKLNFCFYEPRKEWDPEKPNQYAKKQGYQKLGGWTFNHRIIGRVENVISAQVLAEYLEEVIGRLTAERYEKVFSRDATAFREGMVTRLVGRLEEKRQQMLDEAERKKREDAMRARHPGAATSNALVLMDVIESEDDLNTDYIQGLEPGTTTRLRREAEARRRKAEEEARAYLEANPEVAADRERKNKEWWDDYNKRTAEREKEEAERAERRRKWEEANPERAAAAKRREQEAEERRRNKYRAPTDAEKRAMTWDFREGYQKGGDIGLDKQIDEEKKRMIR